MNLIRDVARSLSWRWLIFFNLSFRSSISGVDEEHVDFLPIFVYDKELREYVRNNLKRLDRVRVDGYLKTKNKKDDQGIVRKTSYIEAFRLNKMVSIHRVVDDAGSRKEKLSETQAKWISL